MGFNNQRIWIGTAMAALSAGISYPIHTPFEGGCYASSRKRKKNKNRDIQAAAKKARKISSRRRRQGG